MDVSRSKLGHASEKVFASIIMIETQFSFHYCDPLWISFGAYLNEWKVFIFMSSLFLEMVTRSFLVLLSLQQLEHSSVAFSLLFYSCKCEREWWSKPYVCCDSGGHHAWSWICSVISGTAPNCWTCWRWWAASALWVCAHFSSEHAYHVTLLQTNWATLCLCFAESGERPGNVSAQEQHRESSVLSEEEISKFNWNLFYRAMQSNISHFSITWLTLLYSPLLLFHNVKVPGT